VARPIFRYPQNRKYHLAEFSNPNQQGGQDNKSLIAMMVVFVAVLFGAQFYHAKISPPAAVAVDAFRCRAPAAAQPSTAAPAGAAQPAVSAGRGHDFAAGGAGERGDGRRSSRTSCTASRSPTAALRSPAGYLKQFTDSDGKPLDLVHQPGGQALRLSAVALHLRRFEYVDRGRSRNGGVVTAVVAVCRRTQRAAVAISGVSDSSFNGTYVVNADLPRTTGTTPATAAR
jgi:YidC/Oxa1 family membrane protein insertase